jgi:hypothetical protein
MQSSLNDQTPPDNEACADRLQTRNEIATATPGLEVDERAPSGYPRPLSGEYISPFQEETRCRAFAS